MEKDNVEIHSTAIPSDRYSYTYAGIYIDDDEVVQSKKLNINEKWKIEILQQQVNPSADLWHSPSDVLEKVVQLVPPYTSRAVKGKSHEGIVDIGKEILEKERSHFDRHIDSLVEKNDTAWAMIQIYEHENIEKKVKEVFEQIFLEKYRIMQNEISNFMEQSLQDLETHLKNEVETVSIKIDSTITADLNIEIHKRLKEHKCNLNKILEQNYNIEVNKLKTYYKQLLRKEQCISNKAIKKALCERNDALNAFCKEMEADKITSTMYVMCMERKKYKVKQFLLESYHNKEIREILGAREEKQELLEQYPNQSLSELNINWKEKLKKITQLFLKFISFSLKILPEQTTFLLDLEKIVILQLSEIQKSPLTTSSLLIDVAEEVNNVFKFEKYEKDGNLCEADPFVIDAGDVPEINKHDSQDLPYVRVGRQFIYAKCQKMEEVQKLLDSQLCKCKEGIIHSPKPATTPELPSKLTSLSSPMPPSTTTMIGVTFPYYLGTPLSSNVFSSHAVNEVSESTTEFDSLHDNSEKIILENTSDESCGGTSSKETYLIESFHRAQDCPAIICTKLKRNLSSSSSFNAQSPPKKISTKSILGDTLPFTPRAFHLNVGVQYSTEDIGSDTPAIQKECPCPCEHSPVPYETDINKLLDSRRKSIIRLIQDNPNLLKILPLDL